MNILLLKGYNNRFNRILKREESIADYKAAVVDGNILNYLDLTSINFNPNDGIDTTLVVGEGDLVWEDKLPFSPYQREGNYNPDYAIVYAYIPNAQEGQPALTPIQSRWFVTECERTRHGQYRMALKRDVLADFTNQALNSPCFVEKGNITDVNNPLLFNAEGMKFNEIKKNEILLKDKTKCAWLVGYIKKDITNSDSNFLQVSYTSPEDVPGDVIDVNDLEWGDAINFPNQTGKPIFKTDNNTSMVMFKNEWDSFNPDSEGGTWITTKSGINISFNGDYLGEPSGSDLNRISNTHALKVNNQGPWFNINPWGNTVSQKTKTDSAVRNAFNGLINDAKQKESSSMEFTDEDISSFNNKYIIKNGTIYILSVATSVAKEYQPYAMNVDGQAATSYLNSLVGNYTIDGLGATVTLNSSNPTNTRLLVTLSGTLYVVTATEYVSDKTVTFTLPYSSQRSICEDAQYDMFCMPINPSVLGITVPSEEVLLLNNGDTLTSISSISSMQLTIASLLCAKMGTSDAGLVYDLQILPYCPITNISAGYSYYNYIDLSTLDSKDYSLIYDNQETPEVRGVILYPRKANFSNNIELELQNTTEHYTTQYVENPVFTAQGTRDGLTLWRFAGFPNKVTEGVWDLTQEDCILPDIILEGEYLSVSVSSGLQTPVIMFTNSDIPNAVNPYSDTYTVEGTIGVTAHWILPDNAEDTKIKNECDFQRIVSPNYNGMFQFKKSRLVDGVHYINIDCTYKPYVPYIKLNPDFSGLYGQDWNDSTGLICGGDFSIPMMNDAFTNYELANRNYQAIFSRQIENLDVNQLIAKEQQDFKIAMGTLTGGMAGATAGASAGKKIGGPWGAVGGAIAGAAMGTATGIISGAYEKQWLERAQGEARDFAIDNFNYQLGNIQALPQTMTKSSPLSFNNKIWPLLEEFSCTDAEKEVLRDKLKYDGMTIMAIGKLQDYAVDGGYLKGKLIRLEGLKDDSHVADAIYQEVDKGFYKGE